MRALASSVLAVAGLFSLTASACEDAPMVGPIPDGATATEAQMLAARDQITAYMTAMENYLVCLDDELAAKSAEATAEYKELMEKRIVAGDDERRRVAASFNEALQAYRQANPKPN